MIAPVRIDALYGVLLNSRIIHYFCVCILGFAMKKLLCVLPFLAFGLTACVTADGTMDPRATAATNMGTGVFKMAVDQKCRTELNARNEWKVISTALTAEKKAQVETQICGCVSEESAKQVTLVEMGQAAIDVNARNTIIARAVTNTLSTCIGQFKL